MEFGQKKIRELDLFDFTSFFGLGFFKFSGPLCNECHFKMEDYMVVWFFKDNPQRKENICQRNWEGKKTIISIAQLNSFFSEMSRRFFVSFVNPSIIIMF